MESFHFKTKSNCYKVNVYFTPVGKDLTENKTHNKTPKNITLILLNALGVPLRKYNNLIKNLTLRGFDVISADYPGCGENKPKVNRGVIYGYDLLVKQFIPNLINIAKKSAPNNRIALIGHSIGGQLGTLYSTVYDTPVIGVACGSTHYESWNGLGQLKLLQAVTVIKTLSHTFGYFPGYMVGLGDREPKKLMQDWTRLALSGKFDFISKPFNSTYGKGLYINIVGDEYAPLKATKKLANLCAASKIIQVKLDDDLTGNQHGVWIKKPDTVIDAICYEIDWLFKN